MKEVEEIGNAKKKFEIPRNNQIQQIVETFLSNNFFSTLFLIHIDTYLSQYICRNIERATDCTVHYIDFLIDKSLESSIRQCLQLKMVRKKYSFEGEVFEIIESEESIELKISTQKETKSVFVPLFLKDTLSDIKTGDYVYGEPSIGIIKKIGRSERKFNESDLEVEKYVPIKKGKVFTSRSTEFIVSLDDLDVAFSGGNRKGINIFTMNKTDSFVEELNCEAIKMLIVVKNAHLLNEANIRIIEKYAYEYECYKFLLLGNSSKFIQDRILSCRLDEDFTLMEKLSLVSEKALDSKYKDAIDFKILKDKNLFIISNALQESDTPEDFAELLKLTVE